MIQATRSQPHSAKSTDGAPDAGDLHRAGIGRARWRWSGPSSCSTGMGFGLTFATIQPRSMRREAIRQVGAAPMSSEVVVDISESHDQGASVSQVTIQRRPISSRLALGHRPRSTGLLKKASTSASTSRYAGAGRGNTVAMRRRRRGQFYASSTAFSAGTLLEVDSRRARAYPSARDGASPSPAACRGVGLVVDNDTRSPSPDRRRSPLQKNSRSQRAT